MPSPTECRQHAKVPAYRAYLIDAVGHFRGVRPLAGCTTDDQALALAKLYVSCCEVWDRSRLVAKIMSEKGITRVQRPAA